MKINLAFNWDLKYGNATPTIQQIIAEWASVDWLVAPRDDRAEARAIEQLNLHNILARPHAPELFSKNPQHRTTSGGWPEFSALCAQVRASSSWDWKFSALKPLCFRHSQVRGWRLQDQAKYAVTLEQGAPLVGALFVKFGEHIIWAFHPQIDLTAVLAASPSHSREALEIANWYISYANMDVTHCLEWQLAEQSPHLDGNPFWPLLRCYAEGFMPFGLSSEEVVLFSFRR
jgi:hypothetical protein